MNRFSLDMDAIDSQIPENLFEVYTSVMFVLGSLITIAIVKPWFLIVIPFVLGVHWLIQVNLLRLFILLLANSKTPGFL